MVSVVDSGSPQCIMTMKPPRSGDSLRGLATPSALEVLIAEDNPIPRVCWKSSGRSNVKERLGPSSIVCSPRAGRTTIWMAGVNESARA